MRAQQEVRSLSGNFCCYRRLSPDAVCSVPIPKMSMSTTLRFELNTGNNMKDAFLKQQERIQKDEMMAERENIVRLEKNTNLRAEWNENLEKVSWNKRIQNENKKIQDEVRLAAKAAIAVRRKALQQLIQKEIDMYEQELSLLGKTFFKQRI